MATGFRKVRGCTLAVLAAAAILAAPQAWAQDGTIVAGIGDQWQSLDPQYSSASKDAQILGDLYEGLVGSTPPAIRRPVRRRAGTSPRTASPTPFICAMG